MDEVRKRSRRNRAKRGGKNREYGLKGMEEVSGLALELRVRRTTSRRNRVQREAEEEEEGAKKKKKKQAKEFGQLA